MFGDTDIKLLKQEWGGQIFGSSGKAGYNASIGGPDFLKLFSCGVHRPPMFLPGKCLLIQLQKHLTQMTKPSG